MGIIVNVIYNSDVEMQVLRALEMVKDAYDYAAVIMDIKRIEDAKAGVRVYGNLWAAEQLDQELRMKYPCIGKIAEVVQTLLPPCPFRKNSSAGNISVIDRLTQDYHGIICSTALKKGFIHEEKQYIRQVNGGQ